MTAFGIVLPPVTVETIAVQELVPLDDDIVRPFRQLLEDVSDDEWAQALFHYMKQDLDIVDRVVCALEFS